ncbi:hypothetical protein FOXYSP1_13282 [Fusarium oxysporum f. sp. phaseoli]
MRYSYGSPTSKSGNCTDGEVALHAAMHLRFGTRTIQASGAASDHAHLNVLRLRIHKRFIGGIIESFSGLYRKPLVHGCRANSPSGSYQTRSS